MLKRVVAGSILSAAAVTGCQSQRPIVVEAARGTLDRLTIATTRPGFSGAGYVTGFTNRAGELSLDVGAPHSGIYDLDIRYAAPPGGKAYTLTVDGVGHDGFFPASGDGFASLRAGKVELAKGANRLTLGGGWGFYDIDTLTFTPGQPFDRPRGVSAALTDAEASPEARQLMRRLANAYGRSTFSGVMSDADASLVREATGVMPTILGGDLMDYSPSRRARGADPRGETERLMAAARAGHIVTLCWHWNAPADLIDEKVRIDANGNHVDASWFFGFYSKATTFDFAQALDHPESADHALLLRDIDAIAVELKKLQDAHVPVLWRPLHESDGGWFWWGTRGPDHFKRLWLLLHDRLTNHHGLHNLIWVYTWNDPAWYPGDDVVDVVGLDQYPSKVNDPLAGKWLEAMEHFDGKKLVALTEFGGVPDVKRMARLGIRWSYFVSWTGENGPRKNGPADLVRIYRSPEIGR